MHIEETENEIVLRDVPLFYWFLGASCSFLFGSFFIWLCVYAFTNPREVFSADGEGLAGRVFAVLTFGVFILILGSLLYVFVAFLLTPVITTNINRKTQCVEVTRRNLLRKKVERFYFSQIKAFGANKLLVKSSPSFYLVLFLANNSQIEIETKHRPKNEIKSLAEKFNSFIKSAK